MFNTESERIHVIEEMRKPDIIFPATWDAKRVRQKQSIYVPLLTKYSC